MSRPGPGPVPAVHGGRRRWVLSLVAALAGAAVASSPTAASAADTDVALRVAVSAEAPAPAPTDVCVDVVDTPGGTVLAHQCVPDGTAVVDVPRGPLAGHDQVYVVAHGTGVAPDEYAGPAYPDTWYGFSRDDDVQHARPVTLDPGDVTDIGIQFPNVALRQWIWLYPQPDGVPTTGVRAEIVTPEGDAVPPTLYSATIGSDGIIDVGKLYPGRWWVRYVQGSFVQYRPGLSEAAFLRTTPPALVGSGPTFDMFVAPQWLDRYPVSGQVYDAVTEKPLAGVCVYARPPVADAAPGWNGKGCPYGDATVTDAKGRYRLVLPLEPALRQEDPSVTVIDPSGRHRRSQVPSLQSGFERARDETIDVPLRPAAAVEGRVLGPDGKPVQGVCPWWGPGADDTASHLRVCSDATGWWMAGEIDDAVAAKGKVALLLKAPQSAGQPDVYVPGVEKANQATKLALVPGRRVSAPVTRLRGVGQVEGHVRDAAGRPVAKVQVGLRSAASSDRWVASAVTDAAGAYRITAPGALAGVLEVRDPAGTWATTFGGDVADPAAATPVTVVAGASRTQDVVVRAGAAVRVTARIAGLPVERTSLVVQAYAASGAPVGGRLTLAWADLVSEQGATAVLTGLPEAPTYVRIAEPDGTRARQWWYRAPRDRTKTAVVPSVAATTDISITRSW
ncbi:MAG: hypothetical protein U0Q15_00290 [Kineosporiaceae bacterium]